MKVLAFVAVLIGIAIAAQPNPPTWPTAFSATVLANNQFGEMRFFRWFYDFGNNVERIDGLNMWQGEMYWIEDISDYATKTNTFMAFLDDEVSCFTQPTNGTMMKPNFASFKYIGLSLVGFRTCNHWMLEDQQDGYFMQLWDDSTTRDIVRFDIVNQKNFQEETWTFVETDVSAQDQSLFTVPEMIAPICAPMK